MRLNRESFRVAGGRRRLLAVLLLPGWLCAQSPPEWKSVLERLDRLEQENRALRDEVGELRKLIGESRPQRQSAEERLEIQERRVEEQAQTKVEASQRFPLRVTGMALFNVFLNSRLYSGGADNPPLASYLATGGSGGATFRQSVLG